MPAATAGVTAAFFRACSPSQSKVSSHSSDIGGPPLR